LPDHQLSSIKFTNVIEVVMSSAVLATDELQAISSLLVAAASNRSAAVSLKVPDAVVSGDCPSEQMLSWLHLLNLAATPGVLRLTLQGLLDTAPAVAMLRFLVLTAWETEEDRDKMDLLATWLAAKWKSDVSNPEGQDELYSTLKQSLALQVEPPLAPQASETIEKLRELGARAAGAASLHELVTSGLYRQARAVKQEAGQSFSHPRVLAAAAVWNLGFAACLERLFRQGVLDATSEK
jgi:hypothetical protein